MNPIRRSFIAWVGFFCLAFVSCSQTAETSAVCSRAPELESSLVAVDMAITTMPNVSARQMQSMFAVLLSSLAALEDVAPVDIVDQFSQVGRAYRSVSIALQNVYWEGTVGVSDAAVLASIDDLLSNDNVAALSRVRSFVADFCKIELQGGLNKAPGDAINLPAPSVNVEPQPDRNTGFDNEQSALRSYAYFVAEQNGLVLTPEQALCVGKILSDKIIDEGTLSDSAYNSLLITTFSECNVNTGLVTSTVG